MFELAIYLESKRQIVNRYLETCLSGAALPGRLMEAMAYSLMAGGKRLRPILCLAGAEAVGGTAEEALPAAGALEMIHTYSLIHDDLPAMDNDDLRRGKPTCHIAFDEATAILAGDALLTMAFEILSTGNRTHADTLETWLTVVDRIARAAGGRGMVEGQMRDIATENAELSLDDLARLHALKTGALIQASVCSGALLGGGSTEQIENLEAYARNIGFAFQVKDDVLNVEGDPALLGKNVGTDELRHKSTFPSIMGLEKSKSFAKELIEAAIAALDQFGHRADPLRAIANYIIERKR
ncbi:(2E,6E)-farnesyl diphosphate synthase (EC [Olavius algarvensis associated proteobacterium Delta 3]|nr:(2E,6E)-farnesyl diphosphate synthase (EC [Olavius algarvensis associated proteobacterium Delta 3]